MRRQKVKVLRAVRPNAGLEALYRRKMITLLAAMHKSVTYWVETKYKNNPPEVTKIAMDILPSEVLRREIRKLAKRWLKNFDDGAEKLAEYFAQAANQRSDTALKRILKQAGISVKFTMTPAQKDILGASVHENVSLIKSIPQQYLTQVEGIVMRGMQQGGNLYEISQALQSQFGVSKRKASFIARDQNNKIMSALQHARYKELGVTKAQWMHSTAGKTPRPKHLSFSKGKFGGSAKGPYYDVETGAPIGDQPSSTRNDTSTDGNYCKPGELPNCRCVSGIVIEGIW